MVALLAGGLFAAPAWAKEFNVGTEATVNYVAAQCISSPAPVIPPELHERCFKSYCQACFYIGADGKFKVQLLTPSGLPELDVVTLSTLKRWKFRPATLDGKPVPSKRTVKIEFAVE